MLTKELASDLIKQGKSLGEIGFQYGISKQRVEQILRPERYRARLKLNYAVQTGVIKSQFCEYPYCDYDDIAQAHHPDYNYPLDVIWLCPKHHHQLHTELKKLSA